MALVLHLTTKGYPAVPEYAIQISPTIIFLQFDDEQDRNASGNVEEKLMELKQ